jgi:hypothetical protein
MEYLNEVLDAALHPDSLKDKRLTAVSGLKVVLLFAILLVVINTVFGLLMAVVEGKSVYATFTLNAFSSMNLFLMTVIGIVVTSIVSAFVAEPLFKGSGNYSRTIGFVGYTVVPVFIISSLSILFLFATGFAPESLQGLYQLVNPLLLLASFAWMFYIGMRAVAFSNNVSTTGGLVSYFMGFVIASTLNTPITQFLGPLSMTALAALGGI